MSTMQKRGGQNKRQGVPRYANGDINYRKIARAKREPVLMAKEIAANQSVVREARARHFGLSQKDAVSEKAGTVFGRLRLQGEITEVQYQAGRAWEQKREDYLRAIQAPAPVRSSSAEPEIRGRDTSDGTDRRYVSACDRARRSYMDLRRCVMEADPFGLFALEQVVIENGSKFGERTLGSLRVSCNAIAKALNLDRGG